MSATVQADPASSDPSRAAAALRSRIYAGTVFHARVTPIRHAFRYPVRWFAFDLDELPTLNRFRPWFGHDRAGLLSLHDADYLDREPGTIREKLGRLLPELSADDRVTLLSVPRALGYVFNPVSFYYVHDAEGRFKAALAEVNNTFHERHIYRLTDPQPPRPGFIARFASAKSFHVSPFNDRSGGYEFHLSELGPECDLRVNLVRDGRPVMFARLQGKSRPVDRDSLRAACLQFPGSSWRTMLRILREAAVLHYRKGLPLVSKPRPDHVDTIRKAPPSSLEKIAFGFVDRHFKRTVRDRLTLELPDGTRRSYGPGDDGLGATVSVRSWRLFRRLAGSGEIGFGEGYMEGDWDTTDIPRVVSFFLRNHAEMATAGGLTARLGNWLNGLRHRLRANTLAGSQRNIAFHYDLGNEFYRRWLDPTMLYSGAIYRSESDSLEQAQRNKMAAMLEKAHLRPGDRLLEIGSGWGTVAIEAAQRYGCEVLSVTLSKEQLAWARAAAEKAGVSKQVRFELMDYRKIEGKFDRIISIEMLEAVGHRYLPTYFKTLDRLMDPHGVAVIQVITMPDVWYDGYRKSSDWIRKYIFPGGHLPSPGVVANTIARHTSLMLEDVENIGIHYARTLRDWGVNFRAVRDEIRELGYDERFLRAWDYYLGYCEAGFSTRTLGNHQFVLTRPGNASLPTM